MSDPHVTRETLARLQRRELPPEELMRAVRHLGSCRECSDRVDAGNAIGLRGVVAPVDRGESEHLDPVTQLIPYVDGALDAAEVEIVQSHVDDCAVCRREVEDLLSLRAPRRSNRTWMLALAAAIAAIVVAMAAFFGRTDPETIEPRTIKVVTPPAIETRESTTTASHRYDNAQWEQLVVDAVARKRLAFPATLAHLNPAPDVLRNSGEVAAGGLSPAGVVLEDARPELRWKGTEGATYTVSVYDGETEVARSEPLKQSRWRPSRALPQGRTLAWQVEVTRGNDLQILPAPPAPPALFRIITADEQRELREAVMDFPSEYLLHAVLYARVGLRSEAVEALRRAAASGDEDARVMLERTR